MTAHLGASLVIRHPGPHREALVAHATFTRRGRVPSGEQREVAAYVERDDTLWLPRGLWAEAQRLGFTIRSHRRYLPPLDFGWCGKLRRYQREAVMALARLQGGLLISPPGSGKTTMGLAAVAVWRQPATWLVHTRDLARQARERAEQLFALPPSAIGQVGEGLPFDPGSHLTIAMVQSLVKRPDWSADLGRRSGTVILDEHAHAPAATFRSVLNHFPAAYRCGLGATLSRSDGLGAMAEAVLGPAKVVIPLELLVRQGWVLRPRVVLVPTHHATEEGRSWSDIQRARADSIPRNMTAAAWIARDVMAGHRCMALVDLIDHAHALADLLRRRGIPAHPLVGEVPTGVRERLYADLRAQPMVLVATKVADEGLDLPCLDRLYGVTPGQAQGRIEQQTGRIMRPYPGKRDAIHFDFQDSGPSVVVDHNIIRQDLYADLGFPMLRPRRAA